MGEFIDLGEPRKDKYWRDDLTNLIKSTSLLFHATEYAFEKDDTKKFDSPWEDFDHIKRALYSVRVARRCQLVRTKHGWIWERSKEINVLRNALCLQAIRMLLSRLCRS